MYRVYQKRLNKFEITPMQGRKAAQSMKSFINIDGLGTYDVEKAKIKSFKFRKVRIFEQI